MQVICVNETMENETTETWESIGFSTGKSIKVWEDIRTGNIIKAEYYLERQLTKDEIERELF